MLRILVLVLAFIVYLPCWAQVYPQNVQINVQATGNLNSMNPNVVMQYTEPPYTTCQYQTSTNISIPPSSTNNTFVLTSLFPAGAKPVFIGVADVTPTPQEFDFGLSATSPRIYMNPGGFMIFRLDPTSALPTLYIDNPSVNTTSLVNVFGLANP